MPLPYVLAAARRRALTRKTNMNKTHYGMQYFRFVDDEGRPTLTAEALALRDLPALALNLKFFGYEMCRRLTESLPRTEPTPPERVGLRCKPSTQADMMTNWVAWWLKEIKSPLAFHRKLWELAYVLQALHEADVLRDGARGLGFGCGQEPLPSYFASRGVDVLVTDLQTERAQSLGWTDSRQHTSAARSAFHPHLVDEATFDRLVKHRFVDMNDITGDLQGFDFCWSVCSFEHLGSIKQGLAFLENSLETVRPGGVSVHTTEFNCLNDEVTVDNWPTVLFQRRHFEEIADRLRAKGHEVAPLDFDIGDGPMDRFIDIPPYIHDWSPELVARWGRDSNHLKLSIDGFASTCFGLIIKRAG